MCRFSVNVDDTVNGAMNWIRNFVAILKYVRLVASNPEYTLLVNCQHGRSRSWATVVAVILFDLGKCFGLFFLSVSFYSV